MLRLRNYLTDINAVVCGIRRSTCLFCHGDIDVVCLQMMRWVMERSSRSGSWRRHYILTFTATMFQWVTLLCY